MNEIANEIVLITGATTGIGRATALLLARMGYTVLGTGTRPDVVRDLNVLANESELNLKYYALDLKSADSLAGFLDRIFSDYPRINVLINNAGYGYMSFVEEMNIREVKKQFEVNFFGLLSLTQKILPAMRKAGRGKIINISTVNYYLSNPGKGFYSSSKWALESVSETMLLELAPFNIQVACIEPGGFSTRFRENIVREPTEHSVYNNAAQHVIALEERFKGASPEIVAKLIAKLLKQKKIKFRYTAGLDALFARVCRKMMPESLFLAILKIIFSKKPTI